MGVFKYSPVDFLFICAGLVFLLLDIALDIFAVVSFYQEKAYVSLGILLLLLLGSSFLVQAFSWLWYSYGENGDCERQTKVEKCLSSSMLKLLHVLQLGIYFRLCNVLYTMIILVCSKGLRLFSLLLYSLCGNVAERWSVSHVAPPSPVHVDISIYWKC